MSGEWDKNIFSNNLQRYMNLCNKNQKEIADIVGVSAPTVNDWIKGRKMPRMGKVKALADYFGVKLSDLIEDKVTEEMEKSSDVAVDITIRLGNDAEFREVVKRNLYDKEFLELSKMLIELDSEKIDGVKVMLRSLLK